MRAGSRRKRFPLPIWVLHCFKGKSKKRRATPKSDIDLIKVRLRDLEQRHKSYGLEEVFT